MGRCWTGTPGARVLLAFVSLLPVSLEEDLQQLCLDTSLQRLQAALWQTYEACEAKDAPAPFKSCLPLRVSDPVAVVAQAIVDSILDVLDADKVDIAKLQSVDCLEGLINALAASSRPLLHTSRGQWAAWASFTLASYGCWPLHGLGQAVPGSSWPVRYQDVLNLALSAEAWREHGDKAEFALPPRKPMPAAMLNRLTPSKPPSGPAKGPLPMHLTVLSTGHHASYPVAISAMWRALLPEYEIQIQDHSFDDRYCQLHGTCSADSRFAWLGEHLRGTLVRTCGGHYLKGFEDIASLAEHFFELVVKDSTTAQVDLLLCTHPPYSCRLFWPFVQRLGWPLLGFFGGTLEAHVPEEGMTAWLQDFQAMAQDPRVQFAAIAPFLAEKMRFQSGVDIPASRGFGFHVIEQGGSYFPRRWDEVLLWKGSSECADNEEAFNDAISAVSKSVSQGSGSDVLLRFMHLRELRESVEGASYSSITSFRAVVFVPYEVLLMTFYELYHAAIPIFIPEKEIGVFFMYRGPVTFPHCDLVLSKTDETGEMHSTTRQMPPYSPFNRQNVEARLSWLEAYTDWYQWPHNQQYSSVADLVWKLYETDLQAVSAAMHSETARAMVGASAFWKAAFEKVLAASRGGF